VSTRRTGITIVEVLVLVVIVLVLLGLLLSYLLRMREGAGRVGCAENLRLLGAGLYHTREKLADVPLPASRVALGYGTWAAQRVAHWDLRAPYADQQPAAREAVLAAFLCPARVRAEFLSNAGDFALDGNDHLPGAVGDYGCASGDGDPRFPWDSEKANGAIVPAEVLQRNGSLILRWRSRTNLTSLARGASNTILFGEKHVPSGKFGQAAFGDGSLYNGANTASFARAGGPGFGLAQSPSDPFNSNFGSYHPGLCQFLMADDSVRALANEVNEDVLGQLIRRD
jgi:hypothetical protein